MSKFDEMTKDQLEDEAKRLDVDGRSTMNKDELLDAVKAADAGESEPKPAMDTTGETKLTEPEQQTTNGGFTVGGAGESGDDSALADIPKADGPKLIETDTDPVLDSEADYSEPTVEYVADANPIKSRQEEEAEQHARREAGDARIEEVQKAAGKTPY